MSVIIAHKGKVIARDFMTSYPSGEPAWKPGIQIPDGAVIGFQWDNSIAPYLGFLLWADHYVPKSLHLVMPFFPCSRQDKLSTVEGDQGGGIDDLLYWLAESMNINSITVLDNHSTAVLDQIRNQWPVEIINKMPLDLFQPKSRFDAVIAPDKGALQRALVVGDLYGLPVYKADKVRDQASGKITGYALDSNVNPAHKALLVVDDIFDGGYTFTLLAMEIERVWPTAHRYLMCTHGVLSPLSNGFEEVPGAVMKYDRLIFTDSCSNATYAQGSCPPGHIEIIPVVERLTIERSLNVP